MKTSFDLSPRLFIILFLHQTTTNEENFIEIPLLFIILFLHQTTTVLGCRYAHCSLFIILFLHQTTTCLRFSIVPVSCLSSCSYIKPQLNEVFGFMPIVVYHLVPTSNHNMKTDVTMFGIVVYHLVPTSNHNLKAIMLLTFLLFIILFLHQTTTAEYGSRRFRRCLSSCSYIKPQHADLF